MRPLTFAMGAVLATCGLMSWMPSGDGVPASPPSLEQVYADSSFDELVLALEDRTQVALQIHAVILDELEAKGWYTERFLLDAESDGAESAVHLETDPTSLGTRTRVLARPGGRLVRTTRVPLGYDAGLDELVREIEWLRERTAHPTLDT